jgi:hypothetical protein
MKRVFYALLILVFAATSFAANPRTHDGSGTGEFTLDHSAMVTEANPASARYRQGLMDGTPEYQMGANGSTAGATTLTIAQSVNALTDIVFVQLASATAVPTGVTFNGVAMLSLYATNAANVVYYSTTIPAVEGSYNIVATYAASQAIVGHSVAFKGLKAPFIGAPVTEAAVTGTTISATPASAEDDLVIDFLSLPIIGAIHGQDQVIRSEINDATRFLTISTKTAPEGATTSMSWSWSGSQSARLGSVALKKGNYNYGSWTTWASPWADAVISLPETDEDITIELEVTDLAGRVGSDEFVVARGNAVITATSACIEFGSGGYGSAALLVYNSSGSLLAYTSPLSAVAAGVQCGNLNTSVSSDDGNLYLAFREASNGYPMIRGLDGTASIVYWSSQTSNPDTLTGSPGTVSTTTAHLTIWLRDSSNTKVLGIDTSDENFGPTNPYQLWWRNATYSW